MSNWIVNLNIIIFMFFPEASQEGKKQASVLFLNHFNIRAKIVDLILHVIHQIPIIRNNCINSELFRIMILVGCVFIDQTNMA